jgi:hypothetical protein
MVHHAHSPERLRQRRSRGIGRGYHRLVSLARLGDAPLAIQSDRFIQQGRGPA